MKNLKEAISHEPYLKRIITALVGSLLELAPNKTTLDETMLQNFHASEKILFPKEEPRDFYLGRARDIATHEIGIALTASKDNKITPRSSQLYRNDVGGPIKGLE